MRDDAQAVFQPFLAWVDGRPDEFTSDVFVVTVPFETMWDARVWDALAPDMICHDDRPGQPADRFWWAANQGEVSQFLNAYQSRWLPRPLVEESPRSLAEALFGASRHWRVSIHFNKGLSGAAPDALERVRATSMNPAALDSCALVIAASAQQCAFFGIDGHEPDRRLGAARALQVTKAMDLVRALAPGGGSYANEADYFEPDWQQSFWGANYPRLLEVKQRYDPANLFCVHHGVGSERVRPPGDDAS